MNSESNMSSEVVVGAELRLHRLTAWFDPESAAVVTILFGLFQVVLSVPLAYADQALPKLFILPLVLGIIIVAGGSLTIANERNASRLLLRGCLCSNVISLLGALLAFCLYCYSLNLMDNTDPCLSTSPDHDVTASPHVCSAAILTIYCWSVILLLLLYDIGAMVLHSLLSVSALKALETH